MKYSENWQLGMAEETMSFVWKPDKVTDSAIGSDIGEDAGPGAALL